MWYNDVRKTEVQENEFIASVSKWERGVATPELNLITKMADLFGVSLDAMVGFEVQNGSIIALEKRIHELQRRKEYDKAFIEAEKALLRYPNDFRICWLMQIIISEKTIIFPAVRHYFG